MAWVQIVIIFICSLDPVLGIVSFVSSLKQLVLSVREVKKCDESSVLKKSFMLWCIESPWSSFVVLIELQFGFGLLIATPFMSLILQLSKELYTGFQWRFKT
ncbi:MAG: hypothetical protein U5K51_17030 [Flavobacteriaceae bacterium]|nr:hypothetical protein [Flavobacteriaceae bacterium]